MKRQKLPNHRLSPTSASASNSLLAASVGGRAVRVALSWPLGRSRERLQVEDPRFLREIVVDVDAASVGISSARWTKLDSADASAEGARKVMERERFDLLPIVAESKCREYFCTLQWNDFSAVERRSIGHRDVIPHTTSIRDVIKGFAQESRHYFFLAQERRLVGLISVSLLNCRQVSVWLFSLLAELESELAAFLARNVPEAEFLAGEYGPTASGKAAEIRERYLADRAQGVDAPFIQYLYLSDLVNIVAKRRLFTLLGYGSRAKFEDQLGGVIGLRNAVAHPVRSIVTQPDACTKLWQTVESLEECLFAIRAS